MDGTGGQLGEISAYSLGGVGMDHTEYLALQFFVHLLVSFLHGIGMVDLAWLLQYSEEHRARRALGK